MLDAPEGRKRLALPRVVDEILKGRGIITEHAQNEFLYPKLAQLKDPMSLLGMDVAIERMTEAFLRKEKICIYADFDLDGTSGLALLLKGLKGLGFENLSGYQPRRLKSGYGFHAEVVSELAEQGVSLIVTVDVGITAIAAATRARELGIDVIITDHHQPAETLPDALVVVNPNQSGCQSKLGYLSGAGVAFYLLRALRRGLDPLLSPEAKGWDLKSVLDYFTIATITDMVPLIEDNRVLIKHGLHQLAKTEHLGLRLLLDKLDLLGRPLTSQDVGIRFAPKLNALSRMDAEILPIDIMMADGLSEALVLVEKVIASNQNRIEIQLEADIEAQRLLQELEGKRGTNYVFLTSTKFHRGVIGLIANKISQKQQLPVFIGSIDQENQKVVGSARAPENSKSLLHILENLAPWMDRFGGHHAAAGFEFKLEKLKLIEEKFERTFQEIATQTLSSNEGSGGAPFLGLVAEAEISLHEMNPHFMKWYEFLGPFGANFEVPILKVTQVVVDSIRVLKEVHLKLRLEQTTCLSATSLNKGETDQLKSGQSKNDNSANQKEENIFFLEAMLFSASPRQIQELKAGVLLDVFIEPQWNYFAGRKTIQGILRGYQLVQQPVQLPERNEQLGGPQ
ncbi:MAG: single-stranded-DNA-specific exonuclease RecJ [Bdellovibrionales bacterium]|nr:single-stranded-DNA-specific exonuclease RecJ [Bdellovibrionales bacterium]